MVHVGSEEILLDDARAVRRAAQRARLRLDYREWPGMPPVFPLFYSLLPEAREAVADMARFITEVTRERQPG